MTSEVLIQVEHTLVDGVYTRIAYAKKGTMLLGCGHLKGGTAILLSGEIQQIDGDLEYHIKAPKVFNTMAGTQRVAKILEDTVYMTCHSTEATSVEEAEALLFNEVPQLTRIRQSYKEVLLLRNTTEETVQKEMSLLPILSEESEKYYISKSIIEGQGAYSKVDFKKDEFIGMVVVDGNRLPLARYVNHSDIPNCLMIDFNKDSIVLVPMVDIPKDTELLVNYNMREF